MTGLQAGALLVAVGAAALAGLLTLPERPAAEAPATIDVTLMTTLPLLWGEGDIAAVLAGRSKPAAIVTALAGRVGFVAIDAIDATALASRPLMLAQPRALAPSELVALDRWVRGGGRVLIFTDPALLWESTLPLGDRRRPPATGLLDPVLSHWGLELDFGSDGPVAVTVNGRVVTVAGAGQFRIVKPDAGCVIEQDGLVASCRIGAGRALLIADADVLDSRWWGDPPTVPEVLRAWLTRLASPTDFALQERMQNSTVLIRPNIGTFAKN